MYRAIAIGLLANIILLGNVVLADGPPAAQLLEKAIYQEQAVGDLEAALKLYQRIIDEDKKNNAIAEQARLRAGLIELKLGNHEKAAKILQSLADKYPAARVVHAKPNEMAPDAIAEVMQRIRAHYVDDVGGDRVMTEATLQALLQNLDPYSSYLDPSTLKELTSVIDGKVVGIGAAIELHEGEVRVTNPLLGSPAAKAGIEVGDVILSVDGDAMYKIPKDKRLLETIKRCRGHQGSKMTMKIKRANGDGLTTLRLTRDQVRLPSVTGTSRNDDAWSYRLDEAPSIGYVRIHSFSKTTSDHVREALETFDDDELKGLIVDLRGNAGGMLQESVDIAGMFLDGGPVVEVRERDSKATFDANAEQRLKGVPIALLVNRHTASAAEIFAGALQDRERAIVIGERTFGKGTVQALFPLKTGGAIKLTTARFYLPSGRNLEKPKNAGKDATWGVNPNDGFAIELDEVRLEKQPNYNAEAYTVKSKNGKQRDASLARAIKYLKSR